MSVHEPIRLRIHAKGEEAWSMLHEAFESKQQISIAGRVFVTTNASRKMEGGKIFDVTALLSELALVKSLSGPSENQLVTALRDCVSVMERDLGGLHLIQPELRQAREALAAADAQAEPWDGEGLPPVGTVCEWAGPNSDGPDGWVFTESKVIAYTDCQAFVIMQKQGCWPVVQHVNNCQFRAIKTPEQIEAEERERTVADLKAIWCSAENSPFEAMYDAGYRKQVAP